MSVFQASECYVGALGTCHECDTSGSCICSKYWSGHNHYIALDRGRWDEGLLLCSTLDPLIKTIQTVALACQLLLVLLVLKRLRYQKQVVTDSRLKWQEHLPFFVLAFVLLHLCFAIAFSIQEIITLKLVIGVDALPSLFFFFRIIFLYMAEAANSLNTVKVSTSAEELQRGAEHVRAVCRRERRVIICQAILFCALGAVPLAGVCLAASGRRDIATEAAILCVAFGGEALLNLALVFRLQSSQTGVQKLFESVLEKHEEKMKEEVAFLERYLPRGQSSQPASEFIVTESPTPRTEPVDAGAVEIEVVLQAAQNTPQQHTHQASPNTPEQPTLPATQSTPQRSTTQATSDSSQHPSETRSPAANRLSFADDIAVAAAGGNDSFLSYKLAEVARLRQKIRRLKRTQHVYQWSTYKASMSAGILAMMTAAFALTPYLWSTTIYFVAVQSVWLCYFVLVLILPFSNTQSEQQSTSQVASIAATHTPSFRRPTGSRFSGGPTTRLSHALSHGSPEAVHRRRQRTQPSVGPSCSSPPSAAGGSHIEDETAITTLPRSETPSTTPAGIRRACERVQTHSLTDQSCTLTLGAPPQALFSVPSGGICRLSSSGSSPPIFDC